MWKALLILFVVSDSAPPSMMLGQFREAFQTKADCQKFVASKSDLFKKEPGEGGTESAPKFKVVGHRTECVKDRSGLAI